MGCCARGGNFQPRCHRALKLKAKKTHRLYSRLKSVTPPTVCVFILFMRALGEQVNAEALILLPYLASTKIVFDTLSHNSINNPTVHRKAKKHFCCKSTLECEQTATFIQQVRPGRPPNNNI